MGLKQFARCIKRRSKSRVAKNIGHLVAGTSVGQALGLLAAPLLTRIFTPADFGVLAIYISLLASIQVFSSGRFESAIPLPERDEDGLSLLVLCGIVLVGTTAIVTLVVLWGRDEIAEILGMPEAATALWLLPAGVLGAGVYQALNYWAIRTNQFAAIAKTKISKVVSMLAVQISLGFATGGSSALVLGDVVGRAAGSRVLAKLCLRDAEGIWRRITLGGLMQITRRYRRFPLLVAPANALNTFGMHLPPLLLAIFYGSSVAGWFGLTHRVVASPVNLIGTSVSQAYLELAARKARVNHAELAPLYNRFVLSLLAVGVVPVILLAAFGSVAFELVFGSEWYRAGQYASWMALPLLAQFAVAPMTQMFNILERQDLQMWWSVTRIVAVAGVLIVGHLDSWSDLQVIAAYSVVVTCIYIMNFGLTKLAIRRPGRTYASAPAGPGSPVISDLN